MSKTKSKKTWIALRGSMARGLELIGPFESFEEAQYFQEFFCAENSTSETIELIDPFKIRQAGERYNWKQIKAQFDDPEKRKRSQGE
jgi:hypothetical protein